MKQAKADINFLEEDSDFENLDSLEEDIDLGLEEDEDGEFDIEAETDGESNYGKIYSQDQWKKLIDKFNSNDPKEKNEAGELIYKALLPFIKHVAATYYSTYFVKYGEDLISAGQIGLFENLSKYDPEKGKPTTWCFRGIIHEMRDFIDGEVHHTTPHYQSHLREILKFVNDCKMRGIPYTIDDINVFTGFPKPTILNCLILYERNRNQVSMEQYIGDNKTSIADMLTSVAPDPEDTVIGNEMKEEIFQLMKDRLTPLELQVLALHHGLFDDDPKSAAEIADALNIKKQAIRPTINMAEHKLRNAMKYDDKFSSEYHERKKTDTSASFFKKQEILLREIDSYDFDDVANL